MASFWAELRRRRVIRAVATYVVVAWVLIQITDVTAPALLLPEWVSTLVVFLLVLGFPIAVILAWVYDITADGIKLTGNKVGERQSDLEAEALSAEQSTQARVSNSKSTADERSIAVLPFTNLSSDPDSEYFCDGISEELANDLARIGSWKVAASTSCFYFKGRKEKVQTIGEELGVKVILEGSVRRVDSRVKVAAQLVNAEDGYLLWSAAYENDLNDILQVQEKIARAIIEALDGEQLEDEQHRLVSTTKEEAYQCYLRGRYLWQRRDASSIHQGIDLLTQAIGLDHDFGKAFATLAAAYHKLPLYDASVDKSVMRRLAESAANEALKRDPQSGEASAILGSILADTHRYSEAEDVFKLALANEPGNATAQHWYAIYLLNTGRIRRAGEYILLAVDKDPLNGAVVGTYGNICFALGDLDTAIANYENALELGWTDAAHAFLGIALLHIGEFSKAEPHIRAGAFAAEQIPAHLVDHILVAAEKSDSRDGVGNQVLERVQSGEISTALGFRLCALTGSTQIFDLKFDTSDVTGDAVGVLWLPMAEAIRQDDRFVDLLERFGLPERWAKTEKPDSSNVIEGKFVFD